MSIEAVEQEIAKWDDVQLRRLIAFAVVLQDRKSGRLPINAASHADSAGRWVPLDELDRRLGFTAEELAE